MTIKNQKTSIFLTKISLITWFSSLFLTFTQGPLDNILVGYEIIFLGTLSFFMGTFIFSVFSTYFYLYTVYALLKRLEPVISVIMTVSLGTFLIIIMVQGKIATIYGDLDFPTWGWSPICILVSYALITIAALLQKEKITYKMVYLALFVMLLVLFFLTSMGITQRLKANDYEKQSYFPRFDVLYTLLPLSKQSYVNLKKEIPKDLTFDLVLSKNIPNYLRNNIFYGITRYWKNDHLWQWYDLSNLAVTNLDEKLTKPKYRLIVTEPKPKHYLFTLSIIATNHIIYQQAFISPKNNTDASSMIPPFHELPRTIDHMYKYRKYEPIHPEIGTEYCPIIVHHDEGDHKKEWQWGSHLLQANYDDDNIPTYDFRPDKTICSEHYMLAIRADNEYVQYGYLFERGSGLLVEFLGGNTKAIKANNVNQFELIAIETEAHNAKNFELKLSTPNQSIIW